MQGKRNSTMDIVKAIGIISIVMGHCCYSIMIPALNVSVGEFVYSYHLMVFFFVAGFFYKREYHEHPEQYIGKRLLKLGGMLFLYNTVFTLLHNTLVSVKMISSTEHYSISKMVSCIVQSLLMKYTEELLGACWFLPMFFIGTALFAIAFSKAEKSKKPEYWHKSICILFAAVALYANSRELTWEYWIQTSILAVPIMYIGYFAKQKWDKLDKGITWYETILSAAVILGILNRMPGSIELSVNQILHPVLFYPVTLLGIYFCIGLAKILGKNPYTEKFFSLVGKESFHIMALHFLGFKIVDRIYSAVYGITDAEKIGKFPHSDYGLHISYVIAGVLIPLCLITLLRKVQKYGHFVKEM